jgi:hypothetical protein
VLLPLNINTLCTAFSSKCSLTFLLGGETQTQASKFKRLGLPRMRLWGWDGIVGSHLYYFPFFVPTKV